MKKISLKNRFSLIQITYWMFSGAFFVYIVTLLNSRGISPAKVGFLMAVMTFSSVAGQLVLGIVTDATRKNRLICILSNVICFLAFVGIYFSSSAGIIGVFMFLLGFFKEPSVAVLDSWILKSFHGDASQYDGIRSKGSIAFGTEMLIYGYLLDLFGYQLMPWASGVLLLICTLVMMSVPELSVQSADMETEEKSEKKSSVLKALKKVVTPLLFVFILVSCLFGVTGQPAYNFYPVILYTVGGTTTLLGISLFMNAGVEAIFVRGKFYARLTSFQRLMIGAALYMIFSLILAVVKNKYAMMLAMCVNGMAFGTQLTARRAVIAELVPERFQTTVLGISDMMFSGLGAMMGNAIGGAVMDVSGYQIMLIFCAAVAFITMALIFLMMHMKKKKEA